MEYIVTIGLVVYASLLILLLLGLHNAASRKILSGDAAHPISVVVPFRNELRNLDGLLSCLSAQSHPAFEVILVDDHSSDGGAQVAAEWCARDPRFRLIHQSGNGKKQAITEGILVATSEIIATTDADCTFTPNWLKEISNAFGDDRVMLAFGPVRLQRDGTFFGSLQQIEFAAVVGAGVGAYGLGQPVYCNGANLAYRKKVFLELDGFGGNDHLVSGDDQFILEKVKARYQGGVCFLNTTDAIVSTTPQPSLTRFVHQRLRWAGKWSATMSLPAKLMAVLIVVAQISFLLACGMLIAGSGHTTLFLITGVKVLLEFVLIITVMNSFHERISVFKFLFLQVVYPVYAILIAILSNFVAFDWKGRRHSSRGRVLAAK